MKRPSIALAMIVKNERHNLPRLLESVKGCFDEIHVTDTGSSDGTLEYLSSEAATVAGCPVFVHHFEWIFDFAAARNASFSHVKTDFTMWMDGDDVLSDREAFIKWRDTAMEFGDYWLATYHYAFHANGNPAISFSRERVIRNGLGLKWLYFLHEGIVPQADRPIRTAVVPTWTINHLRSDQDRDADKSRNLTIFEKHISELNPRMKYYYGKELFEAGKYEAALTQLLAAVAAPDLELHDRLIGLQYSGYTFMALNKFEQAINICHQGLQLAPNRAEYNIIIGDSYLKLGRVQDAIPFYSAAKNSMNQGIGGGNQFSPFFCHAEAYNIYPRKMLSRCYYNLGLFDKAESELYGIGEAPDAETIQMLKEIIKAKEMTTIKSDSELEQTNEIVITCPPQGAYEWDEELYKEKAMGGSETAAIEMATHLRELTGLPVKIFAPRAQYLIGSSGVEYIPVQQVTNYFAKYKPRLHIAWRHNIRLTNAPTYLWCHDLYVPGVEQVQNFDKILCLTPFHARYVRAMQGLPEDKILVTRNGINPGRFWYKREKDPNKVVFPSSPDRGLERAIKVMDKIREQHPSMELHVFYGVEHLDKYGLKDLRERLQKMMAERPWVKYHGATQQDKLTTHLKEAVIWLHPCDFIETSCITAMEMLACGVYPVTRRLGGLRDTLAQAERDGMATLLDHDCITEQEFEAYTQATLKAIAEKAWERVEINVDDYSWRSVALEWVKYFDLPLKTREVAADNLVKTGDDALEMAKRYASDFVQKKKIIGKKPGTISPAQT